jgi:hypothetical protein
MNELLIEDLLENPDFQESQYLDFCQMQIDWQQSQILFELQEEINFL